MAGTLNLSALFSRAHLVWVAGALALLVYFKTMKPLEAFQLSGWLSEYGEFDWLELPAWLKLNEPAPPANAALITMSFTKATPTLVALESKRIPAKGRLVRKTATTLEMDTTTAANIVESRNEVWAVMRSAQNRYMIRSASEAGEYVTADTATGGSTCKKLSLGAAEYGEWIIEPAPGTNTFFVRTGVCRDGDKYYLGVGPGGGLNMVASAAAQADVAAVSWEFKAVIGAAPSTTAKPPGTSAPAPGVVAPVLPVAVAVTSRPPVKK